MEAVNMEQLILTDEFKDFKDNVEYIMGLPDDSMTDELVDSYIGAVHGAVTSAAMNRIVDITLAGLERDGQTRAEVLEEIEALNKGIDQYIDVLKPSGHKRKMLEGLFQVMKLSLEAIRVRYHAWDIDLPITLGPGGIMPTYAYETDAAADLYAAEDITLEPHSLHNKISTQLKIALPENWMALILPRSSMGMKTGLRLSNSCGLIDSDYRGEIGVMYDNISDSEYTIHAGDRIAQMLVAPVHRFRAQVVDELPETQRGEGGFGSTGK